MKKVLTSPSSIGKIGPEPFQLLEENGYEVINNPYGRKLTEDEVIELASDCVGIVAGVEPLTQKVMDALKNLRCISRVGVGMDSVDLEYAKTKGIVVTNTPKGPTQAVAELALGLTMSTLRQIPQAHDDMKERKWIKRTGNLLLGKTVGVIGLGSIGKKTAELFKALGNEVIGFDPYPDTEWLNNTGVKLTSFEETISASNILLLHVPGNEDKSAVIGKMEIELMKDDAILINLARGGVVDENALYDALTNKKLASAAVDVFSVEPYDGKLCELENIVLTPHLGSYAKEGKLQMEIDAVKNLIEVLNNH